MKAFFTWLAKQDTSKLILYAMVLGIMAGIFFGEDILVVEIIGSAFIRLIQMTIIPFVIVSLIRGFGSFSLEGAKHLAKSAGIALLFIWAATLGIAFALQFTFPVLQNAAFFSSSLVHQSTAVNPLMQFIPANPFTSIAESIVPAIVLFSVCIGISLITTDNKKVLLEALAVMEDALGKLTEAIFKFAPVGIFALTASTAGTLSVTELSKMQVYYYTFYTAGFLVSMVALPLILTTFLPFSYKELFAAFKGSAILAFTSGSSFIVIPMLAADIKKLFMEKNLVPKEKVDEATSLIPVSFNFPHVGKVLYLVFILFVAWFYNKDLSILQQLTLGLFTVVNFFGEAEIALPALLDQAQLPADAFNIYIGSVVITTNVETGSNAISMFTFSLIYLGLATGLIKLSFRKIALVFGKIAGVVAAVMLGLGFFMQAVVSSSSAERELLMDLKVKSPQQAQVFREPLAEVDPERAQDLFASIKNTGLLRIGYNKDSMPFAYFNADDELVGLDIEFAHYLAYSLGVKLEFVPFTYQDLAEDLQKGKYDMAMSSVTITDQRQAQMDFSRSYLKLHIGFVVRDYERKNFETVSQIRERKNLKIAIMKGSAFKSIANKHYPHAEIVELKDRSKFFKENIADAFIMTAEQGSAWTLLYPDFMVAVPEGEKHYDFIAYPIAKGNMDFLYYLNQKIELYEAGDRFSQGFNRWVKGQDQSTKKKRWSVLRDVLKYGG